MYTYLGNIVLNITKADAEDMAHIGECLTDIQDLYPKYRKRLRKNSVDAYIQELKEYGAWAKEELDEMTEQEIHEIVLWVASGTIVEELKKNK